MRITIFLTLACVINVSARGYSQDKISVNFENVKLSQVFKMIQHKTNYEFLYSNEDIQDAPLVSVSVKNATVPQILSQCFTQDYPLNFKIEDNMVIVLKKVKIPNSMAKIEKKQFTVQGKVIDSTGRPLVGVSVGVKGTSTGTVTNEKGEYSLDLDNENGILVFSFIGFNKKEIKVNGRSNINVIMQSNVSALDQLVVVAYGTQSKSTLTGSIGTLKQDAYQGAPRENVVQSLQGNVAGVRVSRNNGQPGAPVNIHIRGKGSINASSAPLYVVDGVPIETSTGIDYGSYGGYTTSGLAGLNPDDIASLTVLKDASATSIYGSRAANGVVIITTKSGKSGKPKIHFSTQQGFNKVAIPIRNKPLNTYEMLELMREGWGNAGKDPNKFNQELQTQGIDTTQNTDWLKELTRTGYFQQYNLSVSGGTDKTKFFTSGGFYDTKGTMKYLNYKRGTARMKLETKPTNWLKFSANLSGYYQQTLNAQRTSSWSASPVRAIYRLQPWVPIYNPDGTYNFGFNTTYNPVAVINETGHKGITHHIKGNIGATINLLKGLQFETKEAFGLTYGETDMHFPAGFGWGRNTNGRGYVRTSLYKVWTTSNLLRYTHSFNSHHHLSAYIGYEAQDYLHTGTYTEATDFIPNLTTLIAGSKPTITQSSNTEHSLVGSFLHANYDFNKEYFLSASVRRDGSSRFGAKKRFATFWSVGIGWNIYKTLLNNNPYLTALKIRSSYGTNGNQGIGNYESTGRYGTGYSYGDRAGYAFTQYENPLLTWEENKPFDIGIDFGLWNGRLSGTIDYYNRKTTRLLLERPIPLTSGRENYTVNYGAMENKGWEISLSSRNIITDKFQWSSDFNISTLKNKITRFPNTVVTDHYIREVGGNFYTWYLPAYAGVDPSTGEKEWYSSKDKSTKTKDYGDAIRLKYGSSMPKFYGGLTNTFTISNFELSFLLYFNWGNKLYNLRGTQSNSDGSKGLTANGKLSRYTYNHRWQKPGDITDVPKVVYDGPAPHVSSRWLADGSYIRLRNISLTYNIPQKVLSNLHVQSANVYLRANNLLTYIKDDRLMYDPEQSISGQQAQRTPTNKTIVIGVNLNF